MPKNSLLPEYVRKVLESVILRFLITAKRLEKSPETDRSQDFLVRVVIQNFLKKPVISTVFKADE